MSTGLPQIVYQDGIGKARQTMFGGYNHNLYAGDGELWDMENMTGEYYPVLSPRKKRYLLKTLEQPNGFLRETDSIGRMGQAFMQMEYGADM